jgi:hypothetical protein
MCLVLLCPTWIGLLHLLNGVLNGSVEDCSLTDGSGMNVEGPREGVDLVIGKRQLVGDFFGSNDGLVVETSDDLEV